MKNRYGKASAELMLAMLLLVLFSVATFTLTASGTDAYIATAAKNEDSSDLRVSASYIYTRARQSMERGAIRIESYDTIAGDCLVMQQKIDGVPYDTVIFVHQGFLREAIIPAGTVPDPLSSFEIAKLDQWMLDLEDRGIAFELVLESDVGSKTIEGFISTL